jgi:hypothetical protein
MNEQAIVHYIIATFADVETTENFGYSFFFYRDERMLPFVTIATRDNEFDLVSNLARPGVFRLNIGVSKQTFQALFGAEGLRVDDYDFGVLDRLMPHPEYARQSFLCVLNPSEVTWQKLRPLLAEAYELAVTRYKRRRPQA